MALSVTALAGAVLLLSVESSLQTTTEAVERTIADGIAQQTLNEILTKRYVEAGESGDGTGSGTLGPTLWESGGNGIERFNDIDDYAGYSASPLKGVYGEAPGTGDDQGNQRLANFRFRSDYFQNWRQRVQVYYVDPNNPSASSATATAYRAIEEWRRYEPEVDLYVTPCIGIELPAEDVDELEIRLPLSSFLRWVNLVGWAGLAIGNLQLVAPHDETVLAAGLAWERG